MSERETTNIGTDGLLSRFDGFSVLDTETTGLERFSHICSLGIVNLESHDALRETMRMQITLDPKEPIPEAASRVNGFVRDPKAAWDRRNLFALPPFYAQVSMIEKVTARQILVCHNAHFDIWHLFAEMQPAAQEGGVYNPNWFVSRYPVSICTKMTFASILGLDVTPEYRRETSLDNLCRFLGVDLSIRQNGHHALADAELTAACFRKLWQDPETRRHIQVIRTSAIVQN